MSSSINELYIVNIPKDMSIREGFIDYLKGIIRHTLTSCLKAQTESLNGHSTEITLREDSLPSIPNRRKIGIQTLQSLTLGFPDNNEKLFETKDSAAFKIKKAHELKNDLEGLDPSRRSNQPVIGTFDVWDLFNGIIEQFHFFTIVMRGENCGDYFGISSEELYQNTIFNATYVMRTIDFGTVTTPAFNLFYPAFLSLKQNLNLYYQTFVKRQEANING